jgi:prepilin-type N-terminal cleavage/methylation domain-containing protein
MKRQRGFSLIEMMVAVAIFVVITGAMFSLLDDSQRRYTSEAQLLDSFQSARFGYDQMSLDIHSAGFPPQNGFAAGLTAANATLVAQTPFAWSPGYVPGAVGAPCTVGATCLTPGPFDLIIEAAIPNAVAAGCPGAGPGGASVPVVWIRYQLAGTTLSRAAVCKGGLGDPAAATLGALQPYVDNVINNIPPAQMAPIQGEYPGMFPGSNPIPLFTYFPDVTCAAPAPLTPSCVREVEINMIVQSPSNDQTTGRPRVTSLTGQVIRFNPAK